MDAIKKKMQAMKLEKDNAMDRADACEQQAKDANLRAERVSHNQLNIDHSNNFHNNESKSMNHLALFPNQMTNRQVSNIVTEHYTGNI